VTVNSDNIKKIVGDIAAKGYSFSPATFNDGLRCKNNFQQIQLFPLDFDGDISFEDVKKRAYHYDLPILFAYDTFSSEDHDKFRVMFLNDVPIADRVIAEAMLLALGTIFREADASC
jgi:hypothetical protein